MSALLAPILSAIFTAFAWLLRSVIIKFVVLFSLFWLISELAPVLLSLLPPITFGDSFSVLSPGVWFFLDFFQLQTGATMMLSAFVTRFLIRRIPVIG